MVGRSLRFSWTAGVARWEQTADKGCPCRLRSGSSAMGTGGRKGVAVAGAESSARQVPARLARGASRRDPQSGSRVHCWGAAKYMEAARGRVRAGQQVGQSALLSVRMAWRAPAGGRRRGFCALSAGPGAGLTGSATAASPRVSPSQHPRVHPTASRTAGAFFLVRPLVPRSPGMPTTPLPSTLLGRTWGRGRCGVGGRQGARGPGPVSACGGPGPGRWLPLMRRPKGGRGGLSAAQATMEGLHSRTSQGRRKWRTRQAR